MQKNLLLVKQTANLHILSLKKARKKDNVWFVGTDHAISTS